MTGRGRSVIVSAPSGAGKTTIVHHLLRRLPVLEFSVSATNRAMRANEENGRDYWFLSTEAFEAKIAAGEFVEWEEVYPGRFYGTLRAELDAIWERGRCAVFDVDVKGGTRLKDILGNSALGMFIAPPSIDALGERLLARGTESPESLRTRLDKADLELGFAPRFDITVVNDDLLRACLEAEAHVEQFLRA
jgi:guanylate kinase